MTTTHECLALLRDIERAARPVLNVIKDDQSASTEAQTVAFTLDVELDRARDVLTAAGWIE